MKCPFCNFPDSKVVDSRPTDEGTSIRRRRECLKCMKRFTTYECSVHLPTVQLNGQNDVFVHIQHRNKVVALKDKADFPSAENGQRFVF